MKNKMNKMIVGAVIVLSLLPNFASATINVEDELRAQINSLLSMVAQLQAQLKAAQGGGDGTAFCHNFNIDMGIGYGIGNQSEEVHALVTALSKSGVDDSKLDVSNYDEYTASAVSAFQQKYKSEILTPAGLSNGTGYLGARTRAKLNKLYGCGTTSTGGFTSIYYTDHSIGWTDTNTTPSTKYNISITVVNAKARSSGEQVFDKTLTGEQLGCLTSQQQCNYQMNVFGFDPGVYRLTITNQNAGTNIVKTVEINKPIVVTVPPAPSMTVVYPNGGEQWQLGSTQTIRWNRFSNPASTAQVTISLVDADGHSNERWLGNPGNQDSSFNWVIPNCTMNNPCSSNFQIVPGKYKIRVSGPTADDTSDQPFTIVGVNTTTNNSNPSAPTISGPTSVNVGASNLYAAVSTDPDNNDITYTFDWGDNSYKDNKTFGSGNGYSVYHIWANSGIYSVKVTSSDGKGGESTNTIYVKVGQVSTATTPTASLIASTLSPSAQSGNNITANVGGIISYNWSSTGADSASSQYTVSPAYTSTNNCNGLIGEGPFPWIANNIKGSSGFNVVQACEGGHNYRITYTAVNSQAPGGLSASTELRVSIPYQATALNASAGSNQTANALSSISTLLENMLKSIR